MGRSYEEAVKEVNYDEAKVPAYTLSSPLAGKDGVRVKNAFEWVNFRRGEILDLYKKEVYGEVPPRPDSVWFELVSRKDDALENTAVRKEVRVHFGMNNGRKHFMDLLLYLPKTAKGPVPAFLGLCFKGYHVTTDEKDVRLTGGNLAGNPDFKDESRGNSLERWSHRELIRRGYAAATVCYHDLFPDCKDGWNQSIYSLFYADPAAPSVHEKHSAIGAWAWGLSRALDYLETEPMVNAAEVAVHGHSRLGKTALWAGATDRRFRLVISNDSGCGGAALFKRCFGEVVEVILSNFPHWFVTSFEKYSRNEASMPFDQHFLISLIAPRPVCIASATGDLWADPKGEFLSGVHAAEVYGLFGARGLGTDVMPPPDTPITGEISYHNRTGKHDQTAADWAHYLALADLYF
ncbi:MAG: hypothetical protein BWY31_00845 [Lentisphaerae bacterium ADurb.Bin242]|nr:MAG: hypothetical protein BWY31_00845 [Lentisphaerae bacterium ADurb.Bin242]